VGAPVLRVDVLDDLFTSIVLDVEVDVGRLRALFGEEPLEQKPERDRIDGRDPEHVADRGVRRRSAPLAEDSRLAAVAHDLPHREEVAAVVEVVDQRELFVDLLDDRARESRRGTARAPRDRSARAASRTASRRPGSASAGIAIAQLIERERAARGDVDRARDRRRVVLEQPLNAIGVFSACSSLGFSKRPASDELHLVRSAVKTSWSGARDFV
jgi:hypothetical protein